MVVDGGGWVVGGVLGVFFMQVFFFYVGVAAVVTAGGFSDLRCSAATWVFERFGSRWCF